MKNGRKNKNDIKIVRGHIRKTEQTYIAVSPRTITNYENFLRWKPLERTIGKQILGSGHLCLITGRF
jgi:hypothetical protein